MRTFPAQIREIRRSRPGSYEAMVSIPADKSFRPGQYFQAFNLRDKDAAVPTTLFPGGITGNEDPGILRTAPPIPTHWQPGDELILRGPLGNGFDLPEQINRLALAALGDQAAHLLPLAGKVLASGGEVALYTGNTTGQLPKQLEISPLNDLESALNWPDFLAVSGSPEQVASLKQKYSSTAMPVQTQALILTQMPCGAMAACGVCAFPDSKSKILLACEDGPVFDWKQLPTLL